MNPNTVFSASLVTSLVLWFPSMQACLRGDLDLTPAAMRYLAALAVSRLAIGFLARLVSAYRIAQLPAAPGEDEPGSEAPRSSTGAPKKSDPGKPHRRRSDRSADGDGDPAVIAA
jgi:hypothetical protein